MTNNDLTTKLNLKMTGMWEGENPLYNNLPHCGYLIVWIELNSNEMAGALCGYADGIFPGFVWEKFYAQHSDKELTSLLIDYWDKVTGEETGGSDFEAPSDEIHKICSAAEEELRLWHDENAWLDEDQLVLRPELIQDLWVDADNDLILSRDSHPLVNSILSHAGITATERPRTKKTC